MKRILAGLFFAAAALAYAATASSQGDGFTVLFDGKTFENFDKVGDANWRIEDGALVADRGNGFLVTKSNYANFHIRTEFWVGPDANSGIFIRVTDLQKINSTTSYGEHLGRPPGEGLRDRRDRRRRQG